MSISKFLPVFIFSVILNLNINCSSNNKSKSSDNSLQNKISTTKNIKSTKHNFNSRKQTMFITSWTNISYIPPKYIHSKIGGKNISPSITIPQLPPNTKLLLLVVVDHHKIARDWIHWVVLLDTTVKNLPENASVNPITGLKQLKNTWGNSFYEGPKPPSGAKHDYHIVLFALSQKPTLSDKPSWAEITKSINSITLKKWETISYFEK